MILRSTLAILTLALVIGPLSAQTKEEEVAQHIENLKSKDAKKRASAAEQIGKLAQLKSSLGKPAVKPLLETVKDSEADVRRAAVMALARLDEPKEVVSVLKDIVKDDKVLPVRVAAAQGLGLMGSASREAVPTLREIAKEAREKMEMRLAQACQQAIQQIEERGKKK